MPEGGGGGPAAASAGNLSPSQHNVDRLLHACIAVTAMMAVLVSLLWRRSVVLNRRLLQVRVRRPKLLVFDLSQVAIGAVALAVKESLRQSGVGQPCWLQDLASALFVLTCPLAINARGLYLLQALTSFEKVDNNSHQSRRLTRRVADAATEAGLVTPVVVAGLVVLILSLLRDDEFCLSEICAVECYWGTQYLLLLPVIVASHLQLLGVWWLLRRTRKVELLGVLVECPRLLATVGPMLAMGPLAMLLADLRHISPETAVHVCSLCWMAALVCKLIVMHVLPSVTYGYAPQLCSARSRSNRCAPWYRLLLVYRSPFGRVLPVRDADDAVIGVTAAAKVDELHDPLASTGDSNEEQRYDSPAAIERALQTARRRSEALAIRAASFQPDDLSAATSSVLQPMIRRRSSVAFAGRRSSVAADRRSSVAAVDRRTSVFASESPAFDLPPPSYDAPAAVPLAEMTVDQVLVSEDRVLPVFRAFCQSLLCEHMLRFLLVLRPYQKRDNQLMPRVLPEDVLQQAYTSYIRPGSLHAVPLPPQLVKAIKQYCEPSAGDAGPGRIGQMLGAIMEEEDTRKKRRGPRLGAKAAGSGGGRRSFVGRRSSAASSRDSDRLSSQSGSEVEPAWGADASLSTIGMLLELAYLEIEALMADEALPMFKTYVELMAQDQQQEPAEAQPASHARSRSASLLELLAFTDAPMSSGPATGPGLVGSASSSSSSYGAAAPPQPAPVDSSSLKPLPVVSVTVNATTSSPPEQPSSPPPAQQRGQQEQAEAVEVVVQQQEEAEEGSPVLPPLPTLPPLAAPVPSAEGGGGGAAAEGGLWGSCKGEAERRERDEEEALLGALED